MAETNRACSGNLSPNQDTSFAHPILRYRNLFCEMDHLRKEMFSSDNPDPDLIGQMVSHINQESPVYMDSAIQSSPDSGIDMSSPDPKVGYLSSQEDFSPRITDSFLLQDDGKPRPKYPDIGNIQMYQAGMERCVNELEAGMKLETATASPVKYENKTSCFISELNNNHTEMEEVCENECHFSDGEMNDHDTPTSLLPASDTDVDASCTHTIAMQDADTHSSDMIKQCINNGGNVCSDTMKADICESPLKDNCTLAELNLSQTSALSDMLSHASKYQADSSHDNSFHKEDTTLEGNLFPSLEDDCHCGTAESDSPVKMSHRASPLLLQQQPHSMMSATSSVFPLPVKASTPVKSKCVGFEPNPASGEFLLEYQKFLKSCGQADTQTNSEVPTHRSKRKLTRSRKRSDSFTKVLFSRCRSEDRVMRFRNRFHTKTQHATDILIDRRHQSFLASSTLTEWASDAKNECTQQNFSSKSSKKAHKLNPKRFIKAEQKLTRLRRSAVKFLKVVFPNLDYPSPKRTLATVDVLLNQVLDCLLDRKPSQTSRHLQAIPVNDSIKDVRVIVCQSPVSCMRHLRHRICQVIRAVLPNLDLRWLSDQDTEQVNALLRYITQHNRVKKAQS